MKKPFYSKWWYYLIAALFIVSGISYLGKDVVTGIITALIGVGMIVLAFYKKKNANSVPVVSTNTRMPMSFEAVGVWNYLDTIRSVGERSRAFDISEEDFLKKYSDGKPIYEYYFTNCTGALVPEPQNPHDPNAIMVTLNGACVGYVPAELCQQVHAIMKQSPILKISPRGGPRRYVKDGVVYKEDRKFNVYVDIA